MHRAVAGMSMADLAAAVVRLVDGLECEEAWPVFLKARSTMAKSSWPSVTHVQDLLLQICEHAGLRSLVQLSVWCDTLDDWSRSFP